MKELVFRPEVEDDIESARLWYEERRTSLGEKFDDAVEATFDRISRLSKVFAIIFEDVRALQVEGFPYFVYFRDHSDRVEVIALVHGSRMPSAWQSRRTGAEDE